MRAGRSRLRSRSKGLTAPRILLQYATPCLSAHFNLQDRLAKIFVVSNCDIPELKAPCLVGPQSGIDSEWEKVVELFRFPVESLPLRLLRAAFVSLRTAS
jgi:hypothetical protein